MARLFTVFAICIVTMIGFAGELRGWYEWEEFTVVSSRQTFESTVATFANFKDRKPEPAPRVMQRIKAVWPDPVWKGNPIRKWPVIRGKLVVVSEDGKTASPVDWFQGIRVLIARSHSIHPDWSNGHVVADTVWQDHMVRADGSFEVYWPTEIRRPIGGRKSFQIGVCLAARKDKTVTWDLSLPVHAGTIGQLSMFGPEPLTPTMQIINSAPSISSASFDPVALVRAVNHLQAMGKDKAIAALKEFLEVTEGISPRSYSVEPIPEDIDTADPECVFLIVRVLFEPARAGQKLPEVLTGGGSPWPDEKDMELWPLHPLELRDDLPFMVVTTLGNIAGLPQRPWEHIEWAEKFGKLRGAPLRPADNPLAIADALCSLAKMRRLGFGEEIRHQALNISVRQSGRATRLSILSGFESRQNGRSEPQHRFLRPTLTDEDWRKLSTVIGAKGLRWDAGQQEYVVTADGGRKD